MNKTVVLDWNSFIKGDVVDKKRKSANSLVKAGFAAYLTFTPLHAFANNGIGNNDAWMRIFSTILDISDWLCAGVIVFAGAVWMFGNRTKAIEHLIGGAVGYLIIRHAMDIMHWLKSI